MDADELEQAACLADFLQFYLADAAHGTPRELAHYAARFPGHEDLVAREYAALSERPSVAGRAADLPALEGYRVLRELGRGGQGTVYLAEDVALRRPVALKVVRSTLGRPSPTQRARLEREVGILAQLDHPGICTVFRAHLDADPPFVAMRYVPGPTLAEIIDGAAAPLTCPPRDREQLERVLAFFEDAARALHVAHEADIVHRDVKPGNIVYGDDGRPVLLDFGLARPLDEPGPALTRTGDLFGTPAYMSPEQLGQAPDAVDRRTDVWSLGVTLHECLTGRRPFAAPSQRQLEHAICEEPPTRASARNRILPRDLDVVLDSALERDVRRRYATALDLAEELRRVRERRPIRARPSSALLRTRRWSQRNPVLAMALLLLVVGSTGLAVALARLASEGARTRDALRLAESRALAASALAMMERDPVKALDLAIASDELEPGVHSRTALYRALADQQVERVIETPRVGYTLDYDAGRTVLASVTDSRRLFSLTLPDGRRQIDFALPAMSRCVAVSDRASFVAAGLDDGRILVFGADGTRPALTLGATPDAVRSLAFSPDERLLASGGDDDRIHLWDAADGSHLASLEGSLGPPCGLAFSPDGHLLVSWVRERPDLPDRPDPIVRLWDVDARRPMAALAGHTLRVTVVRFSPDGRLLASASDDGTARLWDVASGRCQAVMEHPGAVTDLAFDPAGERLATAFDPGEPGFARSGGVRIFDVADGALRLEPLGHEARPVMGVDWSPDGRRLASASSDGTARVWDTADGRQLACVRSTSGHVLSTRWLGSDARLVVRYSRVTVIVRVGGDAGIPRLLGHDAPVMSAAFSPDGTRVASADTSGVTLVHDVRGGPPLARLADAPGAALVTTWVDDRRLIVGSDDGVCRLYDAGQERCLARLRVGDAPVHVLRVLGDGARIVVASGARLLLAGADDLRSWTELVGHTAEIVCIDVSPDGTRLASGAADRSVRLWDLSNGTCLHVFDDWLPTAYETEVRVFAVLFHRDGRGLLTCTEDGLVRDYALPSGTLTHADGPWARIGGALWLDDDRVFFMAKWSPAVGVHVREPLAHLPVEPPLVGRPLTFDVSRDGSLALASSIDGTTVVWDASDMSPRASVGGHAGSVTCAHFAPDGKSFLTASIDGTLRIWPTDPAAVARARRPVVSPLAESPAAPTAR
ncbi:MAG: protein kinase [Planctomycetes bacterium]|nr:protein kinase [Planctomycetota bacterium]